MNVDGYEKVLMCYTRAMAVLLHHMSNFPRPVRPLQIAMQYAVLPCTFVRLAVMRTVSDQVDLRVWLGSNVFGPSRGVSLSVLLLTCNRIGL